MKKLTIEEKAKAYDEALKVLHKYDGVNIMFSQSLKEEMFPELAESEDEKIKKALIEGFKVMKDGSYGECTFSNYNIPVTNIIAWLEKQGEKKSVDDLTQQEVMDIAVAKCFEQDGIMNERLKPKFKPGDWIINNKNIELADSLVLVTDKVSGGYLCKYRDGQYSYNIEFIDKEYRLWTIEDAKDGDVLIDKSGSREYPFIFKEAKSSDIKTDVLNPLAVLGYCGIGGAGFTKGSGWGDTANCTYYPATKEQRDLLFQKMYESGYEWDAERKELRKIEQKPAEWSTEDEKVAKWVIDYIGNCPNESFDFYGGVGKEAVLSWLNKLKGILQLQPKQDSTDRFFEGFKKGEQSVIENYGKYGLCKPTDKVEPQWKPTDKDIFELQCVINNAPYNGFILKVLLEQLKKLKEE